MFVAVVFFPIPDVEITSAGVAQLDRASVYETEGYRFESCHPRFRVACSEIALIDTKFDCHYNAYIFHNGTRVIHAIACDTRRIRGGNLDDTLPNIFNS